ncbi:hypothetical protein [Anaeromicropila herbilytica]|nr:hypothetical protein [Anaeromicropila herbilytica]
MDGFLDDSDLEGLFDELNMVEQTVAENESDKEMDASSRRYMEIIKKHKSVEEK